MRVFLSYSHADRALANRLRRSLEEKGLRFNVVEGSPNGGTSWRERLEEAIRSADAILLLLNSSSKVDEPQQVTWRLALQAVWKDPSKRWLPILLRDAKLPAFVRGGAAGKEVQAIRIRDPKDLGPAIHGILHALSERSSGRACGQSERDLVDVGKWITGGKGGYDVIPDAGGKPGVIAERGDAPSTTEALETYPAVTEEDRAQQRESFSAIRKYAEQLKH